MTRSPTLRTFSGNLRGFEAAVKGSSICGGECLSQNVESTRPDDVEFCCLRLQCYHLLHVRAAIGSSLRSCRDSRRFTATRLALTTSPYISQQPECQTCELTPRHNLESQFLAIQCPRHGECPQRSTSKPVALAFLRGRLRCHNRSQQHAHIPPSTQPKRQTRPSPSPPCKPIPRGARCVGESRRWPCPCRSKRRVEPHPRRGFEGDRIRLECLREPDVHYLRCCSGQPGTAAVRTHLLLRLPRYPFSDHSKRC